MSSKYLTAVVGELSVLAVGKIVESAVTQIVTSGTGKCKTVDGRELCKPHYMVSASYLTDEGIIKESNYDRLATRATAE